MKSELADRAAISLNYLQVIYFLSEICLFYFLSCANVAKAPTCQGGDRRSVSCGSQKQRRGKTALVT